MIAPAVYQTPIKSFSGQYLYSDQSWSNQPSVQDPKILQLNVQTTTLNKIAAMPIFGFFAGVTRLVLSILHTLGHLFLAAKTRDHGHLYHALKGCCEMLHGLIEMIPIVGLIYTWKNSPPSAPEALKKEIPNTEYVFLVKIVNVPVP